jgi:hypothetical protein
MVRKAKAASLNVSFEFMGNRISLASSGNVRDGWGQAGPDLGADPERPCTFHSQGVLTAGSSPLVEGGVYKVASKHDDKATD